MQRARVHEKLRPTVLMLCRERTRFTPSPVGPSVRFPLEPQRTFPALVLFAHLCSQRQPLALVAELLNFSRATRKRSAKPGSGLEEDRAHICKGHAPVDKESHFAT